MVEHPLVYTPWYWRARLQPSDSPASPTASHDSSLGTDTGSSRAVKVTRLTSFARSHPVLVVLRSKLDLSKNNVAVVVMLEPSTWLVCEETQLLSLASTVDPYLLGWRPISTTYKE